MYNLIVVLPHHTTQRLTCGNEFLMVAYPILLSIIDTRGDDVTFTLDLSLRVEASLPIKSWTHFMFAINYSNKPLRLIYLVPPSLQALSRDNLSEWHSFSLRQQDATSTLSQMQLHEADPPCDIIFLGVPPLSRQ